MKKLKKYLKKRRKNISLLLTATEMSLTPQTFHDLRVELKKLRSFLSLLKCCTDDFKRKRIEKPFDILFKRAGGIREINVEEDMLENYFSTEFLVEYRRTLQERNFKGLKDYISEVENQKTTLQRSFIKMGLWISQVNRNKIPEFMDKRKSKILLLLSPQIQTNQIHLLRKRIKQYNYSQKFCGKNIPPLQKMDSLADLTGKWHDQQVLLHHLDCQLHSSGIQSQEREQIEKIMGEQLILNHLAFNEIRTTIQKIVQQQES